MNTSAPKLVVEECLRRLEACWFTNRSSTVPLISSLEPSWASMISMKNLIELESMYVRKVR